MIKIISRNNIFKSKFLKEVFKIIQLEEYRDYIISNKNKYLFDLVNEKNLKSNSKSNYIYSKLAFKVSSKSMSNKILNIYNSMFETFRQMHINKLYIFFELNESWLHQNNSYPPVKKSIAFFRKILFKKNKNVAFEISIDGLEIFIPKLFWFARCNASLPKIWLKPLRKNILFHLNKYGNIEYIISNKYNERDFQFILLKNNFEKIQYSDED